MSALPFILVINSACALIVGAVVYFLGKKKGQAAVWLVYNILFSLWNFCLYQALVAQSDSTIIYWYRTSLAALVFLVPVFLHFLSMFSDRAVFKKQVLSKIYAISFLFFVLLFALPKEFIKEIASPAHLRHLFVPGGAFHSFVIISFGFVFCGFYYLLRSEKLYLSFKRNQRMWLFFGMLVGLLAPLSFILSIYKINVFPFGFFCIIPYLAIVSYTILRHHVLEMDIVVNKAVVLSYFAIFVLFTYMLLLHILHKVVSMDYFVASVISGSFVLMNLLFTLHYANILKLGKITDHIVYEKRIDYYKFLEKFSVIANKTADLTSLSRYVLDSLIDIVAVESASLYLSNEETAEFELITHSGKRLGKTDGALGRIPGKDPFINFLKEGNIYVSGENKDFAEDYDLDKIKKAFEGINASLAIPLYYSLPLYHSRNMVGFLNLGNKKDGSKYSKEDVDILNAFGRQLSICIDKAKLYSRSIEDDLTKLYRMNYFDKRIEEEIERANRYSRPFSLLMIDIDDFKKVNDTFGHQVGDEVLRRLSSSIKSTIRKADIAARYGGEEFAIVMPETGMKNASIAAERIRKAIEEEFIKDKKRFAITISVGVTDYKLGMNKYQLVRGADEALYKAKREGKNKVCT